LCSDQIEPTGVDNSGSGSESSLLKCGGQNSRSAAKPRRQRRRSKEAIGHTAHLLVRRGARRTSRRGLILIHEKSTAESLCSLSRRNLFSAPSQKTPRRAACAQIACCCLGTAPPAPSFANSSAVAAVTAAPTAAVGRAPDRATCGARTYACPHQSAPPNRPSPGGRWTR
jgi:hypothetical protein